MHKWQKTSILISVFALVGSGLEAQLNPAERARVECAVPQKAWAKPNKPRRLLVVTKHVRDGQERPGHASIAHGKLALELIGQQTGAFEAFFSDELELWRPARIRQFDAVCFLNAVGVLTGDEELRWSLLRFIREGHGFIGFHGGGAATFVQYPRYQFPEFGVMVGGYENGGHPWKADEGYPVRVEEPEHPVTRMLPERFQVRDEAFQFQSPYSRQAVRVLLSVDVERADMDPKRHFLRERWEDRDFPVSWIKRYGRGRVFYTALGHNPEIFSDKGLLSHFLAGIQYALGDLEADDCPSACPCGSGGS